MSSKQGVWCCMLWGIKHRFAVTRHGAEETILSVFWPLYAYASGSCGSVLPQVLSSNHVAGAQAQEAEVTRHGARCRSSAGQSSAPSKLLTSQPTCYNKSTTAFAAALLQNCILHARSLTANMCLCSLNTGKSSVDRSSAAKHIYTHVQYRTQQLSRPGPSLAGDVCSMAPQMSSHQLLL